MNSTREVKAAIQQTEDAKDKATKQVAKVEAQYSKLVQEAQEAAKNDTQQEIIGGLVGQGWHEGLNLLFRSLAEWSEEEEGADGFWASNVDLTQSIPGGIAALLYIVEKALRPATNPADDDPKIPIDQRRPFTTPPWRNIVSEAFKVASHLGLSNTIRALRFRWAENIDEREEVGRAVKERDKALRAAQDELTKLRAQVKKLSPEGPPNTESGSEP